MRQQIKCVAAVHAACLFVVAASAAAENIFSLYSTGPDAATDGARLSPPGGRVGINPPEPRGEPGTLRRVPSYGLRFSHFPERFPNWGIGVDFTHYGVGAQGGATAAGSGLWRGALASNPSPMDRLAQRFGQQPQGVDVLSVGGLYRWREEGNEAGTGRLLPYVGVGLAYYRPSSDGMTGIGRPPAYESSGLGYQMLGGVQYRFTERAGAFVEAKFNSGSALQGYGGDIDSPLRSFHAVAGVSYSF
ncbi:MAG TPA: hypothetical protein VIM12_18395 [Noviherbaspirillum sp.]|uniref:outer membrane protein n=1 Tax=Noviherbaspirillum sp. TaxID=1926288 RepID=UPI002F936BF2